MLRFQQRRSELCSLLPVLKAFVARGASKNDDRKISVRDSRNCSLAFHYMVSSHLLPSTPCWLSGTSSARIPSPGTAPLQPQPALRSVIWCLVCKVYGLGFRTEGGGAGGGLSDCIYVYMYMYIYIYMCVCVCTYIVYVYIYLIGTYTLPGDCSAAAPTCVGLRSQVLRRSHKLASSQLSRLQEPTVSRELFLPVAAEIPFA